MRTQEKAGSRSGAKGENSHEFGLPKRFLKLPVVVAECALRAGSAVALVQASGRLRALSQEVSLSSLFTLPVVLLRRSFARPFQHARCIRERALKSVFTHVDTGILMSLREPGCKDAFTPTRILPRYPSVPDDLRTKIKKENKALKDFLDARQRFLDSRRELLPF